MSDELNVVKREQTGTLRMRRMRAAGQIPAILYGHGEECVNLAVKAHDVNSLIRRGAHVVKLTGAANDSALLKQIQWDALGSEVLHLDLARVSESELVEVRLSIELKGDAPGSHHGGVINHVLHDIEVRCPANQVPEKLELSINSLQVDGVLTAADLPLPGQAQLVGSPDEVVVTCNVPMHVEEEEVEEEAAAEAAVAEPEVIGRKEEESSEGED